MSLLRFGFYRKFVHQELTKNVFRASSSSSKTSPTSSSVSPRRTHDALIDTFGRQHFYLRISLTERCNLRCVYCMPKDGVNLTDMDQLLTVEEQKRIITIFTRLGVTKIRFTGGEPTLNKELPELIRHASQAWKATSTDDDTPTVGTIGMTTNGLVLQQQLERLAEAGLTSVNISLDTLQPDKFATITRRDKKGLYKVLASVYAALALPSPRPLSVKINVVLIRGFNDDELRDFVMLTQHVRVDVRFIELMPFEGNQWTKASFMGYREAIERLKLGTSSSNSSSGSSSSSSSSGSSSSSSSRNISSDDGGSSNSIGRVDSANGLTLIRTNGNNTRTGARSSISVEDPPEDPHDTTKWYRVPGHRGRVGFITSMSDHFCSGCNRLRITADGKLKVCLFGSEGLSLLDAFRSGASDDEIVTMIGHAVKKKQAVLGGHGTVDPAELAKKSNRPMILIGG